MVLTGDHRLKVLDTQAEEVAPSIDCQVERSRKAGVCTENLRKFQCSMFCSSGGSLSSKFICRINRIFNCKIRTFIVNNFQFHRQQALRVFLLKRLIVDCTPPDRGRFFFCLSCTKRFQTCPS